MTLLDEYQQANPGSDFSDSWKRFKNLLDEETYFFAPKSYGIRAQRSLLLIPESERLNKARQQLTAYHHYFPLKKFIYWLFDIGDISAKRVWVAYSDLWKKPERSTFVEQLNTFQQGFNLLAPLLHRPWKKVIKSIQHFLSFLSQPENCGKSEWRSRTKMKADIELVEWRRLSTQSQVARLRGSSVLTLGSGLSSSTADRVAKWVSPSQGSQADSKQLTLSSDLSVAAPTGFNLSRDHEIRWTYVFICSFFDIDWTDLDKNVVQQNAERSFRKHFALKLHPDKKPEFFNKDWGTRAYWENKVAEARKGQFDSAVEMRDTLLKILEHNDVIDLKWVSSDHQALLQAVKQGNELHGLTFRLVKAIEGTAKAELEIADSIREREEHIRHIEEYNRQADEVQKELDELKRQKKERAQKQAERRERFRKDLAEELTAGGVSSEGVKEILANTEKVEKLFQAYTEKLAQKLHEQKQSRLDTHETTLDVQVPNAQQVSVLSDSTSTASEMRQVPIFPDTVSNSASIVSAKALIDRTNTSGFLDKSIVDQAIQLEKENVTLDQFPGDEQAFSVNKSSLVRSHA